MISHAKNLLNIAKTGLFGVPLFASNPPGPKKQFPPLKFPQKKSVFLHKRQSFVLPVVFAFGAPTIPLRKKSKKKSA
jgi:hypothetical protein